MASPTSAVSVHDYVSSARAALLVISMGTFLRVTFRIFTLTGNIQPSVSARNEVLAVEIPLAEQLSSATKDSSYGPSLLAAEVETILHLPSEAKIVIQLMKEPTGNTTNSSNNSSIRTKTTRDCVDPFVLGRLSGPYVTLVHWEKMRKDHSDIVEQMVGYYAVPSPGRYFLEVIGILCNDLTFETNYKDICLEDPTQHRITHESAFIDVPLHRDAAVARNRAEADDNTNDSMMISSVKQQAKKKINGYWKWSPNTTKGDDTANTTAPIPLLTRYQPHNCRKAEDLLNTKRCADPTSLKRFAPYQFVYTSYDNNDQNNREYNDDEEMIRSKAVRLDESGNRGNPSSNNTNAIDDKIFFCFVGLSHAREMAKAVGLWLQDWNLSRVTAKNIDAQFPRIVSPQFIQRHIIKCHKTVIAAGQWSAGRKPPGGKYRGMPPTLFPEYRLEVKDMISRLKDAGVVDDVFLRSVHYNSLGDIKTTCPPQDWRSPPVIDMYNAIIENLTTAMNVPYIDTNFIIGPMWDSAGDYCHYRDDDVSKAEALYVLGQLLR